jgi:hypothetical protein
MITNVSLRLLYLIFSRLLSWLTLPGDVVDLAADRAPCVSRRKLRTRRASAAQALFGPAEWSPLRETPWPPPVPAGVPTMRRPSPQLRDQLNVPHPRPETSADSEPRAHQDRTAAARQAVQIVN